MKADVIVVANKWWEVSALISVLTHADARPVTFDNVSLVTPLGVDGVSPRLRLQVKSKVVEVWCIKDLMDPSLNDSLTWEKARVLPYILKSSPEPSLVVAFGTAASPSELNSNGNVMVGTRVFLHDPYEIPPDPDHHWTHARLNEIVDGFGADVLARIPKEVAPEVQKRLLRCPNAPADPPTLSWSSDYVEVGVVNVTNRADYPKTDKRALDEFKKKGHGVPESLETTHGVIGLVLARPFIFVSGLANRVGRHDQEVMSRRYAQNFVAAHNAAIAIAWILEHIV